VIEVKARRSKRVISGQAEAWHANRTVFEYARRTTTRVVWVALDDMLMYKTVVTCDEATSANVVCNADRNYDGKT
jgi:hypothetical protein